MSSLLRATLITLALLTSAGCTSKPVLNTQHDLPASAQVSEEKVKQAIVAALQKREWTVQRLSPQLVQAEITVRNQFYAAIDIRYTRNSYAITYRDSQQPTSINNQAPFVAGVAVPLGAPTATRPPISGFAVRRRCCSRRLARSSCARRPSRRRSRRTAR